MPEVQHNHGFCNAGEGVKAQSPKGGTIIAQDVSPGWASLINPRVP